MNKNFDWLISQMLGLFYTYKQKFLVHFDSVWLKATDFNNLFWNLTETELHVLFMLFLPAEFFVDDVGPDNEEGETDEG